MIVNVHHFADMGVAYLKKNDNFDMRIEVSREDVLLDTGGGLKKAAWFFQKDSNDSEEPFVLHNVDVVSTIDLDRMMQFHRTNHALATLAVQRRETSRYLLVDEQAQLCGRLGLDQRTEIVRPSAKAQALAFSGVHLISPRLLPCLTEEGAFSIITSYLRLAGAGERILGFRADEYYWRDLGRPENVAKAIRDVEEGALRL